MSRKQNLHSRITQVVVVQIHLSHHREVPSYRNTDISRQYYGMQCHDLRATGWDKSSTAVRTGGTGREETDGSQPEASLPMKRTATLLPKASQMNTVQDPSPRSTQDAPNPPRSPQDNPQESSPKGLPSQRRKIQIVAQGSSKNPAGSQTHSMR